ncbi:protoglobin domain-containing protein [Dyella silvatica]|uniref:protoglobin domain-containing protein n=1 Tax=Dyella silvatica TaxID=2992128 RepID=UPI0022516599|nr:protoglobin domain-containing protein [Dyella silvatica]
MNSPAINIPGYTYGTAEVAPSPSTLADLERLKVSTGFTKEDEHFLRMAGDVLQAQVETIVNHWRANIIAGIPHLARHSRNLDGTPAPDYLARSNQRFQQWIRDTCLRPYDQDWLNYQHEIALRHTRLKKNQTDGVSSTPYVPYGDIIAFVAVLNGSMRTYLAAHDHDAADVSRMHNAWCKSIHIQMALWAGSYMGTEAAGKES